MTVLSAQPSYQPNLPITKQPTREVLDGMTVKRVRLFKEKRKDLLVRGCNGVIYSFRLFFHILLSKRYDVVVSSTFPPLLPAFLACVASRIRGCRFIYHCQDLHPELSLISRSLTPGWRTRLLAAVDSWTCRNARAVIVLSSDMRNTILSRSGTVAAPVFVINNFELPDFPRDEQGSASFITDRSHTTDEATLHVIFAGNLGRFQGLDTVIMAAAQLKDVHVRITLMGEGMLKAELRKLASELECTNVSFIPFQEPTLAKRIIAEADFGLVTLNGSMHKVAYPSKTMTYLCAGCPIIAMIDRDSELAKSVIAADIGLVSTTSTPEGLAEVIRNGYKNRARWRARKSRVREYANRNYSQQAVLSQWEQLIGSI